MTFHEKILETISDRKKYRNDIARIYGRMIILDQTRLIKIYWQEINEAIIARWSLSALEYIKNRTWRWVESIKIHSMIS